jgi:hypothetical protein
MLGGQERWEDRAADGVLHAETELLECLVGHPGVGVESFFVEVQCVCVCTDALVTF